MQDLYQKRETIYFLPIGGTAMATLAGLLHDQGHRVLGVDAQLYPPMKNQLEDLGIPVRMGFDPARIPDGLDRVIIGNAVPRTNAEVLAVLERGVPYLSQAEAVAHYLLAEGRRSVVVAGTHGKTTTTSLLAWILESAGTDPSYLVGGMLPWCRRSFRLGNGPWMVIEGDEYNTAFFDRGPKFLHYRPEVFLLGPVEYDHADIYRDLDAVLTAFRAGTAQVPVSGAVVVNGWDAHAVEIGRTAAARVVVVGEGDDADLRVTEMRAHHDGMTAVASWMGGEIFEIRLPLSGRHNIHNSSMALAAALHCGVSQAAALQALAAFPGVARRMEVLGTANGVTVVDDFAHHPTALAATITAARERWSESRLVVVFEPRSLSASRRQFQDAYVEALALADVALVALPYHRARVSPEDLIDRDEMARQLADRGVLAVMPGDGVDPATRIRRELVPGDVVLGCSSGDFGGFHRELLRMLAAADRG